MDNEPQNPLTQVTEVEMTYKSKQKASERPTITASSHAAKIFKSLMEYDKYMEFKEIFYAMYLNRSNKVLSVMKISEGGTCGTVVDVLHVAQPAILQNAKGVILCHNHPSGQLKPSNEDLSLTKKIKEALKLFDVSVLDHVILTDESYYSFADEGML